MRERANTSLLCMNLNQLRKKRNISNFNSFSFDIVCRIADSPSQRTVHRKCPKLKKTALNWPNSSPCITVKFHISLANVDSLPTRNVCVHRRKTSNSPLRPSKSTSFSSSAECTTGSGSHSN